MLPLTVFVFANLFLPNSHYLALLPHPPLPCLLQQHHAAHRLGGRNGLHQEVPSRRLQAQHPLLIECSPSLRSLATLRTALVALFAHRAPPARPRPLFPGSPPLG